MKIRKLLMAVLTVFLWFHVANARTTGNYNGENGTGKNEVKESASTSSDEKEKDNKEAKDSKDNKNSSAITPTLSAEEQLNLLNEKVRKLEEMVERQQRVIETLQTIPAGYNAVNRSALPTGADTLGTSPQPTATSAAAVTTVVQPVAQAAAVDEQTKKLDALYKAFGQFNITGDLRFRYDGQFNQGFDSPTNVEDRDRLRIRARLQLAGQFHNNFDYGIRVSTGGFTNPTGANATESDFFNRKAFALDRYFLRYDTKTAPVGLILQVGKFDYPWKRTELTFDNDLQPEGAAETLYFKGKNVIKDFRIIAYQLPFNEVAGGKDSVAYGGQVQTTLGKGNWNFVGAVTFTAFNQVDALARALGRPNTQVGGGLELLTTNRVRRDSAGNIIGFVANYDIFETIGEVSYTGYKKFPISLLFNYARNVSDRLDKLKERNGYWGEFKVGRLKEKGDIEFTYTFARVQQDAVLSVFSFDDFLGTNNRNQRITAGYTLNSNAFVQVLIFFNEKFNTLPRVDSRTQHRVQFDVNYRF